MRLLLVSFAATGLALAGCSSTDTTSSPSSPPSTAPSSAPETAASSSSAPTPAAAAPTRIEVTVAGGKVTTAQPTVSVALGTPVLLVVSSDKADEVHVHGYDKEGTVAPGKPAEIRFDATIPGAFEVETHVGNQRLVLLQVR